MREATESLTHADSRLWQTLAALLFRPGLLTQEFLQGRRARYLPPFRLYLVVSVLFFILASLMGGTDVVQFQGADGTIAPVVVEDLTREAEQMAARSEDPIERAAGERLGDIAAAAGSREGAACEGLTYSGPWADYLQPRFKRGCERASADGGRTLGREFMANVPRMLFVFLPLIALVMKLLYWRPKRYYVEHLLFIVHNHSFVFVLFACLMLVLAVLPESVGGFATLAAFAYCAWYFFRALRVVYGQSRKRTLLKYSALALTYVVSGVMLSLLTLAYSVMAL
jgi:hypothetical protein